MFYYFYVVLIKFICLDEETDFIDLTNAYKRLVYESKFGTDSFNVTDPR